MRRSTPALVLCLAAGAQVGALVSLASAHGTSAGVFSGRSLPIPLCPRRGFRPLSIQPIDFVALYQQHLEAEQAQDAAPPAEA